MKKTVITLGLLLSSVLLIAGGNAAGALPKVADIPKVCYADKTYVESDAHLMWQDQKYTDSEDGAYKRHHSAGKVGNWNYAVNYCRRLNYAGYSDWRLPTEDELMHVHNIPGQVFSYFRANDFWTSTPTVEGKYYVVYPTDAYPYKRSRRQSNYIRCVRCLGR